MKMNLNNHPSPRAPHELTAQIGAITDGKPIWCTRGIYVPPMYGSSEARTRHVYRITSARELIDCDDLAEDEKLREFVRDLGYGDQREYNDRVCDEVASIDEMLADPFHPFYIDIEHLWLIQAAQVEAAVRLGYAGILAEDETGVVAGYHPEHVEFAWLEQLSPATHCIDPDGWVERDEAEAED